MLVDEPRLPYNLETEPGIRATLLRLSETEHVLILMMHHIICDWSSVGVFWRELSVLYRAGCCGKPLELPALPIQHGDYAVWQQQQADQGILADDLEYWEENLRGAPALIELSADRATPAGSFLQRSAATISNSRDFGASPARLRSTGKGQLV